MQAGSRGGGNGITVTINSSGLAYTDTPFSLLRDIRAGQTEFVGDEWDWGAVSLEDGLIPAAAPRLRIGNDPQIFRLYKTFVQGGFVYALSPTPPRDIQAGARIRTVTGARTVAITLGETTDPLTDVITWFDLLSKINASSTLVRYVGTVINDRSPQGQGATDVNTYTQSYVASVSRDGSEAVRAASFDITAAAASPTEQLELVCTDATVLNSEIWSNVATVSGQLAPATTGVPYADGPYAYTVPPVEATGPAPESTASAELVPQSRPADESYPSLCYEDLIVGAQAPSGTFEFVWRKRPIECSCDDAEIIGGPNYDYLGITDTGETAVSEQSRLIRVQRLAAYIRQFIASNTGAPKEGNNGGVKLNDVRMANRCANIFHEALAKIATGTTIWPDWAAEAELAADTIREPVTKNGYRYAFSGGATGATEPTWPTTIGGTVSDGDGEWTNLGISVWAMYDVAFVDLQRDLEALKGRTFDPVAYSRGPLLNGVDWDSIKASATANNNLTFIDSSSMIFPTTRNGHLYIAESLVSTNDGADVGATEPTWPTNGGTVVDGDVTWRDAGAYWVAETVVATGAIINPHNGALYVAEVGGETGTTEPEWTSSQGVTITDGAVTWRVHVDAFRGRDLADTSDGEGGIIQSPVEDYYQRYVSAMNEVLAAAGLPPDFEGAGLDGNGIWQDHGGAYWFESRNGLLPLQPGHYYHSARMETNAFGRPVPVSTEQFGIGVAIACAPLKDGDILTITINLAGVARVRYQQGDRIKALITRAQPLVLSGGQTGNNQQTWSVVGSVAGPLANYVLSLTAPAAYSASGLGFLINQGGIPFQLGDSFSVAVSASQMRHRKNGGDWSANIDIAATVALSDGLSASFIEGPAPSWVTGDRWSFLAEAVNGVDQLRRPTGGALAWTTSQQLDITVAAPIAGIALVDHTIPSDAVITLLASNDAFATAAALTQVIAWAPGSIWLPLAANYTSYRITIDDAGSIFWLWLAVPLQLQLVDSSGPENGRALLRRRLPGAAARPGRGVRVRHEWLDHASVDAFFDALDAACVDDDGRLAVLLHDSDPPAFVRVVPGSVVDVPDEQTFYKATDRATRRHVVELELEPVP